MIKNERILILQRDFESKLSLSKHIYETIQSTYCAHNSIENEENKIQSIFI